MSDPLRSYLFDDRAPYTVTQMYECGNCETRLIPGTRVFRVAEQTYVCEKCRDHLLWLMCSSKEVYV